MKTILSLFDFSGRWPFFFSEKDYRVITVDIKDIPLEYKYNNRHHISQDIMELNGYGIRPDIILAAIPCTDFACAGARYFKQKDKSGQTQLSINLVHKTLEIIKILSPRIWAIENPRTRMHKLVPELGSPQFKFHPWEFGGWVENGERHNKETWLWGNFNIPEKRPISPLEKDDNGHDSWYNSVGGKSEKTKTFRSQTPLGFAKAFCEANYI